MKWKLIGETASQIVGIPIERLIEITNKHTNHECYRTTLKKEMKLLLIMSNYLSDNRTLKKDKIEVLMNAHLVTKINFIKDGKHVFYRDHLKKMVESNVREKSIDFNNIITLNNDLDETRS